VETRSSNRTDTYKKVTLTV